MEFTRTEKTLATLLARSVADRTAELSMTAGYPRREPGDGVAVDELDAFVQGMAEGALLAVLGQPPDVQAEQAGSLN